MPNWNLHKEVWDKDKLAGKIPAWLKGANQEVSENPPPLVEKCCDDHLSALIFCEFAHHVHLLGVHWGIDASSSSSNSNKKGKNGATQVCSAWSKCIHAEWHQPFSGCAVREGLVVPSFPCMSST